MSVFVDSLTGTPGADLSTRAPWAKHPDTVAGTGVFQFDTAGTALVALTANSTTNQALYQPSTVVLGSSDQESIGGWLCKSVLVSGTPFITIRQGKTGGDRSGYGLRGNITAVDGTTTWQLYKIDSNGGTALVGSWVEGPGGWIVGQIRTATLRAIGGVVTVHIGGSERINYTDPSPVMRAGIPGLMAIGNQAQSTGYHLASITINDLTPLTPLNTVAPSLNLDGAPRVGTTMSCSTGTWLNAVSFAYQWRREGASIPGAIGSSYTLQAADVDKLVTCTVTATNPEGPAAATSNPVFPRAFLRRVAVSRESPVPDPDWSILLTGDGHLGDNPTRRYEKYRDGINRIGPLEARFALHVNVGDAAEGETTGANPPTYPEQDILVKAWFASFNDDIEFMEGNHDTGTEIDGTPRTREEWEAAYGILANDFVDLPNFRFVKVSYQSFFDNKAWAKGIIDAAAPKKVVLGIHYPMRNTIGGGTPPHDNIGSTKAPDFILCLSSASDAAMRELIAECPNLVAIVTGHCHAWYDSEDFICKVTSGSNSVAHVNASAVTYVGQSLNMGDPLIGYVVTLNDGGSSVSVRMRDAGRVQWRRWPDRRLDKTIVGVG